MASRKAKRPIYDGNACMLYDYMVTQNLTEEEIVRLMGLYEERIAILGKEDYERAPWMPISGWLQEPARIPQNYIYDLCKVLNAPMEAVFMKSRILNGQSFSLNGHIARAEKQRIEDIPSEDMIQELKKRGFKVFKEI